jgi:hypothetical protein
MRIFALVTILFLSQFPVNATAQKAGDEPGWSIMVVTVASACGADRAKVNQAAIYIEQWATRHLQDPSRLTRDVVMQQVDGDKDVKNIVEQKGAFIHPCDRWRQMLELFLESKGSVMDSK